MKRRIAAVLIALLLLGAAAVAEERRVVEDNEAHFAALFNDLLAAYETPSEGDDSRIDADLESIRGVSEADYAVAGTIADCWRRVFLDDDYPLYLHDGGERAAALEAAGLRDGDIQAIVVLGYELKDGEMTDELKGRCDAAAAVARSFPGAILVCSGGATGDNNPDGHTEAGLMKDYLANQCGIDAARIRTDERAMTTAENAVNTFAMLETEGIGSMTLVTSAYHQQWSQVVYSAVGALYARSVGWQPEIVANYCLDIEPSSERLSHGASIALRQVSSILNLPKDTQPPKDH